MIEEHSADLPVPLTSLIGREREIAEICALLSQEGVRLVTLTGPGGVGKTRLALAVAARLALSGTRKVFFVDLTPVADPELVLAAIAQQFAIQEVAEKSHEEIVLFRLRTTPVVLVLDNFEQVIDAAPLLTQLLHNCPELALLITSRERLRVSGEVDYDVGPLRLPRPDGLALPGDLLESEAACLFIERACAVQHGFVLSPAAIAAIAMICKQLDGLPLAIELAAARVKALSPQEIQRRLFTDQSLLSGGNRDQPVRQQTMRDTIAWSYNLLSDVEQHLFRQLAVFSGGCTLEAAEAIATESDVVGIMTSLVDKSLVKQQGPGDDLSRFRMLETIRQYGLEQLESSGELVATRQRHAAYFLNVVTGRNSAIPFAGDFGRVERLAPDRENLRIALITSEDIGDERGLLQLAVANYELWRVSGLGSEPHHWLMKALAQDSDTSRHHIAWAYGELGEFAWHRGNYVEAASFFEREMEIAQHSGSEYAVAIALSHLGGLAYRQGDLEQASQLLISAGKSLLSLAPQSPDAQSAACIAFSLLGDIAIVHGEFELAAEHLERSISMSRSTTWSWIMPDALAGLGIVHIERGEIEQAVTLYLEGIELANSTGYIPYMVSIAYGLAAAAASVGQVERAARLLSTADRLRESVGSAIYPRDQAVLDRCLANTELDQDRRDVLGEEISNPEEIVAEAQAIITTLHAEAGIRSGHSRRPFGLTPRELDVLRLIAEGHPDSLIAERLFIARRTVNTHTSSIFAKLGVNGRTEAAAFAVRRGLA